MKKIISRIITILSLSFFIMFFIGEAAAEKMPITEIPKELLIMILIFIVIIVGFIISLNNNKLGGKVMIIAGATAGLYLLLLGGLDDIGSALIYSLPFIISGVLLL